MIGNHYTFHKKAKIPIIFLILSLFYKQISSQKEGKPQEHQRPRQPQGSQQHRRHGIEAHMQAKGTGQAVKKKPEDPAQKAVGR